MTTLSAEELHEWIASKPDLHLIDVLPEEHYQVVRLPGSRNACVYETVFLERVVQQAKTPESLIVVYGSGAGTRESAVAAEKLSAAGFTNVHNFEGGIAAWEEAGWPLDQGPAEPSADPLVEGTYFIDTAASVVRWTGRNLFNHHEGTVRLGDGEICARANELVTARFTIDLRTIACTDLSAGPMNDALIRHLNDADFFDVGRFPTAEFRSQDAVPVPGSGPGRPNVEIRGELTLRGVTKALGFFAVVAAETADHIVAQAQISIDRTEWGCLYGSSRFFSFLGKHVVNDHVDLHVKIRALRR